MQHLFSEFKPVTAAEWKAQLGKDLKGESFESLIWKNENGFDIPPFYTGEDLSQNYEPAFTHSSWEICVNGKSKDAQTLNRQLLGNLNGGATAICVHCKDLDLSVALKDIQLNYIHASFYINVKEISYLKAYLEKNHTLGELRCSIFPENLNTDEDLKTWLSAVAVFKAYPDIKVFSLDALPVHNQNCFAYYEVAVILSALNEFFLALPENERSDSGFVVKTGVSADYFIQIAKLRAIRRLWKILSADYGINRELYLIVETSSTNKSLSDNYNNLLRSTMEAMAAVSGGCNELIVTEFDLLLATNQTRSERMAINQQLILKEESYLDKMADVSCGSYYLESITDAIAQKALESLKRFEAAGGYFKCLQKSLFRDEIASQGLVREQLINTEEQVIIGVNKFRNEKEKIVISQQDLQRLRDLPIHNPVLKFELEHYFNKHA